MFIIDVKKKKKRAAILSLKHGVLKIFTFSLDHFFPPMKDVISVHNPPAPCIPIRWLPKTAETHKLKTSNALFNGRFL